MTLGICLSGVEENFERALRERATDGQPFVYLELGTANAETWFPVLLLLQETDAKWRTIGIDPATYAFENYYKKIAPYFTTDEALMLVQTREQAFTTEKDRIGNRLDFVFIDGCHSQKCAMADFLSVEPLVVPGGLVVFHDIEQVPGEIQEHCNAPRGVREALEELGLWKNTRPGWKRLPDWTCDKTKNAFSCACFEKV